MFKNKKAITFSVLILLLLSTIFFAANSGSIKASVGQLAVGIFTGEYANVNAIIDVSFPKDYHHYFWLVLLLELVVYYYKQY